MPLIERVTAHQVRGQQAAHLVAAQHPPAAVGRRVGDRDGAAVGVGVVGEHQVGVVLDGRGQGEVDRARFLGVGERHGGEVRVGVALLGHHGGRREAGALEGRQHHVAAHAVQRGVDDAQVAG